MIIYRKERIATKVSHQCFFLTQHGGGTVYDGRFFVGKHPGDGEKIVTERLNDGANVLRGEVMWGRLQ